MISHHYHVVVVCAKRETNGPPLVWAHNLFVMWALDFLPRVVPRTETQQNNSFLRIPKLLLPLLFCYILIPPLLFSLKPFFLPQFLIFIAQN